ncbi:MAG: prepilin-type N-terminal cleavage/methylation domain-containing protein [Magnetococcales bacterium]|nr:prepilin-type N-terminal cleavage/methylation domain-containing protein [Magnetococcales bacterium]
MPLIPPTRRIRAPQGFTLLEVMIGMVLSAILVLGVSGLWAAVGDQFFRVTLRQKAVLNLHGQTERIAAMYRHGAALTNFNSASTGYTYPSGAPANRNVLLSGGDYSSLVKATLTVFEDDLGGIYASNSTATANSAGRNVVWLDKERRITARLSWTAENVTNATNTTGNCLIANTGAKCQLIAVYLDYPYRFTSGGADPLVPMWDQAETVSVQTIVGQWK